MSLQSTIDLDNFVKMDRIGFGSFGEVFEVKNKKTGEKYAAKVSLRPLEDNSKSEIRNLNREIDIISRLNHPTVLRFVGFSPTNFYKEDKPTMITDYMKNGSLEEIISLERQSLSAIGWDDTRKLITIYGIASAMKYLHENKIIHRDLKPGNILMDEYLIPKIADFGLSKIMHADNSTKTSQSTIGLKGTILYMAPEIHLKNEYSTKTDVYAFAIIVYEIVTNQRPFNNCKAFEISWKVTDGVRPEFVFPLPKSYRDLIEKCWAQDPNNRPSFEEIVSILENDDGFITDTVDEDDYLDFINFIKEYKTTYEKSKKKIDVGSFIKRKSRTFTKMDIKETLGKVVDDSKSSLKKTPSSKSHKKTEDEDEENSRKPSKKVGLKKTSRSITRKTTKDNSDDSDEIDFSAAMYKGKKKKIPLKNETKIASESNLHKKKGNEKSPSKSTTKIDSGNETTKDSSKGMNKRKPQIADKAKRNATNDSYKTPDDHSDSSVQMRESNDLYMKGLRCYHSNSSVDREQALQFFEKASQLGNAEAMYIAGVMHYTGKGTPVNKRKALEYFEMGASKNHLKSTVNAANMLNNGEGVAINQKEAAKYFKKAADAGDARSMYNYANMLRDGLGVPIDRMESLKYYKMAADRGDVDAMYLYAWICYNGEDVPVNKAEAAKYYKKAIDEFGDVQSMAYYALMLESGDSVPMDKKKAAEYFRIAAEHGNDLSIVQYGLALINGEGVQMNKKEGVRFLKMAADKGFLLGLYEYGLLLYRGDGVNEDKRSAAYYLKLAADKGLPSAIYAYAQMLEKGDGIPVDRKEASRYFAMLSYSQPVEFY